MVRMVPDETWHEVQMGVNHASKLLQGGYATEAGRVLGELKRFTDDAC